MIALIALALTTSGKTCCDVMAEMTKDPAFMNLHPLPKAIQFTPKYGQMTKVDGALVFMVPPEKKSKVGVVMIHEFWGLNDNIKQEAEMLYEATGYAVAAVDLYGGKVATSREDAGKYMRGVDKVVASKILLDTIKELRDGQLAGKKLSKIGTVGYCMGGGWSLQTALLGGTEVDACVMYYGFPETDPAKLENLHAPVLGLFGNKDTGITPAVVDKFEAAMKEAKKKLEVHRYDAGHGFANPSNPTHDEAATQDAFKQMIAFYKRNLK